MWLWCKYRTLWLSSVYSPKTIWVCKMYQLLKFLIWILNYLVSIFALFFSLMPRCESLNEADEYFALWLLLSFKACGRGDSIMADFSMWTLASSSCSLLYVDCIYLLTTNVSLSLCVAPDARYRGDTGSLLVSGRTAHGPVAHQVDLWTWHPPNSGRGPLVAGGSPAHYGMFQTLQGRAYQVPAVGVALLICRIWYNCNRQ